MLQRKDGEVSFVFWSNKWDSKTATFLVDKIYFKIFNSHVKDFSIQLSLFLHNPHILYQKRKKEKKKKTNLYCQQTYGRYLIQLLTKKAQIYMTDAIQLLLFVYYYLITWVLLFYEPNKTRKKKRIYFCWCGQIERVVDNEKERSNKVEKGNLK